MTTNFEPVIVNSITDKVLYGNVVACNVLQNGDVHGNGVLQNTPKKRKRVIDVISELENRKVSPKSYHRKFRKGKRFVALQNYFRNIGEPYDRQSVCDKISEMISNRVFTSYCLTNKLAVKGAGGKLIFQNIH